MVVFGIAVFYCVYALLVVWQPATILAAMISFFAMEQWAQANSTFFANYPRLMNYSFALLVLLSVVVSTARRGSPLRNVPSAAWPILGLVGYSFVSYFWSINPLATSEVCLGSLPYILVNAVMLPLVFRDLNDVRLGILSTIMLGIPMVLLLSLGTQVRAGGRSVDFANAVVDRYGRVFTGGNPLAIGSFGGYLTICCLFFRPSGAGRFLSIFRWVVVAFALALIVRSQSRGQLVAVLFAAGVMMIIPTLLGSRLRNMALAVFGILFFVAILPWALSFSESETRFDYTTWGDDIKDTRLAFSAELFDYWLNHSSPFNWLFGMGSGSSWHVIEIYPHVVPLEVLVELGILGFSVYFTALILLGISSFKSIVLVRRDANMQSIVSVVMGLWLFTSILTLKEGTYLSNYAWMAFSILLAKIPSMAESMISERDKKQRMAAWLRAARLGTPVPSPTL